MEVKQFQSPQELFQESKDYLKEKEIENGLIIGILSNDSYGQREDDLYLLVTENQNPLLVAAKRGKNLILAGEEENAEKALSVLSDYIKEKGFYYPGIVGSRPLVDMAVPYLQGDKKLICTMDQRIYKLEKVKMPLAQQGQMRNAKEKDKELVAKWVKDFSLAANEIMPFEDARKKAESLIEKKVLFLWEVNGRPVSMCAKTRPAGRGITVAYVYTPKEERKKGYASCLVSKCSQMLLEEYPYVMLYTDLANPTSNKIYQEIGYKPVVDSAMYDFETI